MHERHLERLPPAAARIAGHEASSRAAGRPDHLIPEEGTMNYNSVVKAVSPERVP
jgi:hypothetical protein